MASSSVMRSSWVEEDDEEPSVDEGPVLGDKWLVDRTGEENEAPLEILSMDSSSNAGEEVEQEESVASDGMMEEVTEVEEEDDEEEEEEEFNVDEEKPPLSPLRESSSGRDDDKDKDESEYETLHEENEEENDGTEHQVDHDDDHDEETSAASASSSANGGYDDNNSRPHDIEAPAAAVDDDKKGGGDEQQQQQQQQGVAGAGAGGAGNNHYYVDNDDNDDDGEPTTIYGYGYERPPPRCVGPPPPAATTNHGGDDEDAAAAAAASHEDDSSAPRQTPPSPPPSPKAAAVGGSAAATANADAATFASLEQPRDAADKDQNNEKDEPSSGSSGSKRRRLSSWQCMCCVILLLLAAALGVGLGVFFLTRDKGDGDEGDADKDILPPLMEPETTLGFVAVQGFSGEAGSGFGQSVALTDKFLVFGSPTIDGGGGPTTGIDNSTTTIRNNNTGSVSTFQFNGNDNNNTGVDSDAVVVANSSGGGGGGSDAVVVDFGDTWRFLEEIAGQEGNGQFGFTVGLLVSGGGNGGANNAGAAAASAAPPPAVLIGAPHVLASGTAIPAGAVYFFQSNPSTGKWDQGSVMQGGAELFNANEEFGAALAAGYTTASNVRLVIGAPGNNEAGRGAGRVYVFERQDTASDWTEMTPVPLLGEAEGARLGSAVDISQSTGNVIVAGAPDANSISIYEYNGQEWSRTFLHTATDGGGLFGSSVVVVSDNMVAVGSPAEGGNSGAIHLFQKMDGVWQSGGPTISGEPGDALGSPRTIDGIVGVLGPELTAGTSSGFVKRFDLVSTSWVQKYAFKTGVTVSALSIASDGKTRSVLVGNIAENKVTLYHETSRQSQQTAPTDAAPVDTQDPDEPSDADESTSVPTPATEITWHAVFTFDDIPNSAVSLGDSIFAVGVPSYSSGVVQTFQRNLNAWESLLAIYEIDSVNFGESVSLAEGAAGTYLAVGAPGTLDASSSLASGAVFFYQLDGEALTQLGGTIRPPVSPSVSNGKFGASVVTATQQMLRVAIGEPEYADFSNLNLKNGRVHIMEFGGVEWTPMASPIEGSTSGGLFGSAVDMTTDGVFLLVGAPGSTGEVYYYERDSSEWKIIFAVPGSELGEGLGTAVAILSDDGNMIAMGAPNFGSNNEGVVRVYERTDDGFFSKIGSDIIGSPNEAIGSTLSGSKRRLVVGSALGNFHAFSFDLNTAKWVQVGTTPTMSSGITSIATNGDATNVAVGFASEQVFVYNLS